MMELAYLFYTGGGLGMVVDLLVFVLVVVILVWAIRQFLGR